MSEVTRSYEFCEFVADALYNACNVPVVQQQQSSLMENYPYITYTVINWSTATAENMAQVEYIDVDDATGVVTSYIGRDRELTMSITARAETVADAIMICEQARDYIEVSGRYEIQDATDYTIVSITGTNNRSNLISVEYEYAIGFDLTARTHVVTPLKTERIETTELNNGG